MTPASRAAELLPCPLCEGRARYFRHGPDVHWIECLDCDMHGPTRQTEGEAIAAWNRRAPDAAAPSQPAERAVDWRPIESAPRDKTFIVLAMFEGNQSKFGVGWYMPLDGWQGWYRDNGDYARRPTGCPCQYVPHPAPRGSEMADRKFNFSKEWCMKMAKLEGDAVIGAGVPDPHPMGSYGVYKPSIWARLGFLARFDNDLFEWRTAEPTPEDWFVESGLTTHVVVQIDWLDRLRLLVSGRVKVDVYTRTNVLVEKAESHSQFSVLPPMTARTTQGES